MPRFPRRGLVAIVSTTIGLAFVFSFKTPDATTIVPSDGTSTGARIADPTVRPGATAVPGATPAAGTTAAPAQAGTLTDGTVTGQLEETRFGPVQVQVTISGGRITEVTALQLPSGGRSGRISSFAEPALRSEALSAQSANIDIVSGATYTSDAYAASLQSALDQARG